MGKRRQERLRTVLPVRVSGVDQSGKPFAELVHTLDISHSGARLGGVALQAPVGTTISVQTRLRKCQFSITWVGAPGSSYEKQIGLRNLEPQRDVFGASLKDQAIVDDYVATADNGPPRDDLSRIPGKVAAPPKPPPVVKPAAMSKRLRAVTAELDEMEKLMQSGTVNPEVLSHLRDALSRVRSTAWALQQSMEHQEGEAKPGEVLSYLNAERIAVAIRLCDSLYQDLQKADVSLQKEKLQVLLTAVEKLFTRLAAMDLTVLEGPDDLLTDPQQPKKPKAERA